MSGIGEVREGFTRGGGGGGEPQCYGDGAGRRGGIATRRQGGWFHSTELLGCRMRSWSRDPVWARRSTGSGCGGDTRATSNPHPNPGGVDLAGESRARRVAKGGWAGNLAARGGRG